MRKPLGVHLLGIFLVLATALLAATTITLFHPGTFVDLIWEVKPEEYARLSIHRSLAGTGFLVLGILMAAAAYGWFKARPWAWWLVQVIFAVNAASDLARALGGEPLNGLVGAAIVGGLILYVRSSTVRAIFRV